MAQRGIINMYRKNDKLEARTYNELSQVYVTVKDIRSNSKL
jgi:hypothetical protein